MTRKIVRQAVQDFLSGSVTNLDVVNPTFLMTRLNQGGSFNFPPTAQKYGWAVLFIEHEEEHRITTCDNGQGEKEVRYRVRLDLFYQTRSINDSAEGEFDELIDSLHARLRSDRTLGSATIFEACEGPYGIQGDFLTPAYNDTDRLVTCAGTVRFEMVEFVTG